MGVHLSLQNYIGSKLRPSTVLATCIAHLVHRDTKDCCLKLNSLSDFRAILSRWRFPLGFEKQCLLQIFPCRSLCTLQCTKTFGYFQSYKANLSFCCVSFDKNSNISKKITHMYCFLRLRR